MDTVAEKVPQVKVVPKNGALGQARIRFFFEEEASTLVEQLGLPAIMKEEMKGKIGHVATYIPKLSQEEMEGGSTVAPRELFVGLGSRSKFLHKQFRQATTAAVSALKSRKITKATIVVPTDFEATPTDFKGPRLHANEPKHTTQADMIHMLTNSILLGTYQFDKYHTKSEDKLAPFETINLEVSQAGDVEQLQKFSDRAAAISRAQAFCKNLANERADVATPAYYEKQAYELANRFPTKLAMEALHAADLKGLGMNLLLAVGQGATVEPRLVLLHYNGDPESNEKIALVGKGITFDTGGINLKPTGAIEDMYIDNAGAATVLSVLQACVELDVKRNLVVALCLAENAISQTAVLPSSIIKSYKGTTVEIGNTDAEGRLVLADGLTYVQKHCKPTHIVDVATLTGACVVALGEQSAGLFTNDDVFSIQLRDAGDTVSEVAWPLPILDHHTAELKGVDSDLKNIGKDRYGGASTAAAFLKEFIEPEVKWCHLDIAGPAKTRTSGGATAFGVKLLTNWLSRSSYMI
jgi:leucyl aminopeptidase